MRRAKPGSPSSNTDVFAAPSTHGPFPQAKMTVLVDASSEWSEQVDALRTLTACARSACAKSDFSPSSSSPPAPEVDALLLQIRQVAPKLSSLINDLRSSLVKEVCDMIEKLAALLGPLFVCIVDIHVIPSLLKRACTTKAVIRDSAVAAASALFEHGLDAISKHVVAHLSTIVVERKAAVAMRSAAATFIGMIAAHPALPANPDLRDVLESAIAAGVADSDETVRATSRRNWLAYVTTNTVAAKALLDRIPLQIAHLILRESADELPFLSASPSASPDRPRSSSHRPTGPNRVINNNSNNNNPAEQRQNATSSPSRPSRATRASLAPNALRPDPPRPSRAARVSLAAGALRSVQPTQTSASRPPTTSTTSTIAGNARPESYITDTSSTKNASTATAATPTHVPSRNPFPPPPRPPMARIKGFSRPPRRSLAPGVIAARSAAQATTRPFHIAPATPIADAVSRAKAVAAADANTANASPTMKGPSTSSSIVVNATPTSPANRVPRSPTSTTPKASAVTNTKSPGSVRSSGSTTSSSSSRKASVTNSNPKGTSKQDQTTSASAQPRATSTAIVETPPNASPVKVSEAAMETARTLLRSPAKASPTATKTPPSATRARIFSSSELPPTPPSVTPSPMSRKRSGDDVVKPPTPERLSIVRRAARKPIRRVSLQQQAVAEPASKSARRSPLSTASSPSPRISRIPILLPRPGKPSPARESPGSMRSVGLKEQSKGTELSSTPNAESTKKPQPATPKTPVEQLVRKTSGLARKKTGSASSERPTVVPASQQGLSDSASSEPTSSNESVPDPVDNTPSNILESPTTPTELPRLREPQEKSTKLPDGESDQDATVPLLNSPTLGSPSMHTEDQTRKLRLSFIMGENKTPAKSQRKKNMRRRVFDTVSQLEPPHMAPLLAEQESPETDTNSAETLKRRGISAPQFEFDDDETIPDDEKGEDEPVFSPESSKDVSTLHGGHELNTGILTVQMVSKTNSDTTEVKKAEEWGVTPDVPNVKKDIPHEAADATVPVGESVRDTSYVSLRCDSVPASEQVTAVTGVKAKVGVSEMLRAKKARNKSVSFRDSVDGENPRPAPKDLFAYKLHENETPTRSASNILPTNVVSVSGSEIDESKNSIRGKELPNKDEDVPNVQVKDVTDAEPSSAKKSIIEDEKVALNQEDAVSSSKTAEEQVASSEKQMRPQQSHSEQNSKGRTACVDPKSIEGTGKTQCNEAVDDNDESSHSGRNDATNIVKDDSYAKDVEEKKIEKKSSTSKKIERDGNVLVDLPRADKKKDDEPQRARSRDTRAGEEGKTTVSSKKAPSVTKGAPPPFPPGVGRRGRTIGAAHTQSTTAGSKPPSSASSNVAIVSKTKNTSTTTKNSVHGSRTGTNSSRSVAANVSRRATRRSVMPARHTRASIAHSKMASAQMRASTGVAKLGASGAKTSGATTRTTLKASAGIARAFSGITKSSSAAKSSVSAGTSSGGSDVKTSPAKVEAVKRAASVPARIGTSANSRRLLTGKQTSSTIPGTTKSTSTTIATAGNVQNSNNSKSATAGASGASNVDELRAAVHALRELSGKTLTGKSKAPWNERLKAVSRVTEKLKALGSEAQVPGGTLEECVQLIGEALHDVHHRVTMAALDAMFFILLCTTGAESATRLQRVLDKRPEIVRRVLQLLRDGREDVRLAGGRVMQSFEVQFSAEVQVGLVLRAMGFDSRRKDATTASLSSSCHALSSASHAFSSSSSSSSSSAAGAAAGAPYGGLQGCVDERVGEMGCGQLVRAFERADRCEDGFVWSSAVLQRLVTGMAALARDRRVHVRRGADAVVAAIRKCLPEEAFEIACRKFNVSFST